MQPLLDLLLRIGITSPEAESLMRGLFIHRAREWLTSQAGASPSDSRVALVTGVHRNFVRKILAQPPEIPRSREGRAYRPGRLLRAWRADPQYCDDGGNPRDIPEIGPAPSFATLAAQYLPGHTPSVVLEELLRAGAVQSLAEHRVRIRSRTARPPGLHLDNVAAYGKQVHAFLTALTAPLLDPEDGGYFEVTPLLTVPAAKVPIARQVLSRRAGSFLTGLEQELGRESRAARGKSVRMSVAVIELKGQIQPRERNRRERSKRAKRPVPGRPEGT